MAQAQNLTSRSTEVRYNATYGGGGTVFTPSDEVVSTTLTNNASVALSYSDSVSGLINNDPMRPWAAAVSVSQAHEYEVVGPFNQFKSLSARGGTSVTADASGEGLATMLAGNQLTLSFSLAGSQKMRLTGLASLTPDGQNLASSVALQRWDGIVWQNTFNSLFLPGQEGSFDKEFDLIAGEYRIVGSSSGNAFTGVRPQQSNDWEYNLSAVPEPASLAALGLGAIAAMRRRRK